MNKQMFTTALIFLWVVAGPAFSGEKLSPEATATMEAAGFQPFPGSVFCTGTVEMGMRFATSEDPAAVRSWFIENLASWSLYQDDQLGLWMLFDGPPEIKGFAEISVLNNLLVQENKNLPGWHDLDKNMTTEILVALPRGKKVEAGNSLLDIPPSDGKKVEGKAGTSHPEGLTGSLQSARDMESISEEYYYYLQDENYNEYIVAYESELPNDVARKLEMISNSYKRVRIVGDTLDDDENGIHIFDRNKIIQVYPVEDN